MKPTDFAALWTEDGNVFDHAPRWARLRSLMRDAFPTYYSTGVADPFARQVGYAIRRLDDLKPPLRPDDGLRGGIVGRAFLGDDPSGPRYGKVTEARLGPEMKAPDEVIRDSIALFRGLPNWNHPLTMPNVIPPANIAAIIAAMMTEVFGPNIIEGEYAWDVEISEMESAAILARLIGWDPTRAGGLYTFGGSGCYLYGVKYALTRVLGAQSRCTGIRTDAKLLVSQQGHYCKLNSSDWTGLGMNNIVEIETAKDTNAMDVKHLEHEIKRLHKEGIPIAAVVCTMGTTDAFAMDPVAKARELIDKYGNPEGFGPPLLYCDAVIGWSWLSFGNYDFKANPLGFSKPVLEIAEKNLAMIREVRHADAIGCDFHKVGWAPYNCSLFVMRELEEFKQLMTRPGSDYLQERTCYNPGLYTLEVSRSGSYSMAGWATLKFFGHEGFQAVLGGILEMEHYLRNLLDDEPTLVCVNPDDHGFVTLFRVYPKGVNADKQYRKELTSPKYKDELKQHNELQGHVADKLWEWFRDGQRHAGEYAPYVSYTTGFRPTTYNREETDPDAVIYAIKSFPMNLNVNPRAMETVVKLVLAARDEVAKQTPSPPRATGDCPPPYDTDPEPVDCQPPDGGKLHVAVQSLLSGTGRRGG